MPESRNTPDPEVVPLALGLVAVYVRGPRRARPSEPAGPTVAERRAARWPHQRRTARFAPRPPDTPA